MTKVEQFIKDYTNYCSNELCAIEDKFGKKVISYREWLTPDQALRAVEIARGEMMDKACEWWENELTYPSMTHEEIDYYQSQIVAFRKAMEE